MVGSDHAPIHIRFDVADRRGSKTFKFEDMWFEKTECLDVIKGAWTRGGKLISLDYYNYKLSTCRIDLTS